MFKSKYTVGDLRDFLMNSHGDGLSLSIPNKLSDKSHGYVFITDIDPDGQDDDNHVYVYNPGMKYELWLAFEIRHYHIQLSWSGDTDMYIYAESNEMKDNADLDSLFESYLDDFESSCANPTEYNYEEDKIEEFAQFLEKCIDTYKAQTLTETDVAQISSLAQDVGINDIVSFITAGIGLYNLRKNPDESMYQFIVNAIQQYKERNATHPE